MTAYEQSGLEEGHPPDSPNRGTSLTRKQPAPLDHHRALGIALLYGPESRRCLISEVPL